MKKRFEKQKEKYKITVIAILLTSICLLTYHFHAVLETGTVFTHFYYIPIILASLWWKRKGLVVTIFLVGFLILSHILLRSNAVTTNDYFRASVFVVIGFVVATLSQEIAKANKRTKLAYAELNQMFHTAADGMRVIDRDFNVLRINQIFSIFSGVSEDESMGKRCYEVFHGSLCHTPNCPLTRILGGEERVECEVEKERTDGIRIPYILTATPFREPDGKLIGIVEDFKDITERKQAEEAVRKARGELEIRVEERTRELGKVNEELRIEVSEHKRAEEKIRQQSEFLGNILESLTHPFYVIDAKDHTIKMANSAACLGSISKDSTCYALTHKHGQPCTGTKHPCPLEEVKKTKRSVMVGHVHYDKDGNARYVEIHGHPIFDKNGNVVQMIEYSLDITERKRAENQIKTSLKEKEVLLREIHHRVKNNLQVISSLLNLQSKYIKNKPVSEMFKEGQNRIKSMALIHEQLYQSKDLERIDFAEYIRKLATNLFCSYRVNPNAIVLKVNVDSVFLSIDTAIPCGLIIDELLSNSLKHAFLARKKGEICIDLHSYDDSKFALIISDNGTGFPKDLDFRNTESLGLQLVCTLTDQLGGTIKLNGSYGTEFKITFGELNYKKAG